MTHEHEHAYYLRCVSVRTSAAFHSSGSAISDQRIGKKHALKIWWRTFQASPDSSLTVFYPKIETCFCSFIASAGIRYEIVGRFLLFLTAAFMCICVRVMAIPFILSLLRIVFPFLTFPNKVRAILVVRAFHVFSISVYVFGFGYRAQHIVTPPCSYNGIREKKKIYIHRHHQHQRCCWCCVVAWIERRKKKSLVLV